MIQIPLTEHERRLIAAAPMIYDACKTTRDDSTRLTWLSALLHQLRDEHWAQQQEDPEACGTALFEAEALVTLLQQIVARVDDWERTQGGPPPGSGPSAFRLTS